MIFLAGCLDLEGGSTGHASLPPSPVPSQAVHAASPPTVDAFQAKLEQMTVHEKIGQLIFAGIDGYEMNQQTRELIEMYYVGGIILYKTNVKNTGQLTELVNGLKQKNTANRLPIWLGVDEEGGRVTRLPDEIVKTPPNKVIGNANSKEFAYSVGSLIGKELSAYGLNVDFAPDLDINSNPKNLIIGDRSFGENAAIVSTMGIQTMKGLQAQRVLPVVKHFPGHGDTSVDSHVGLPIVQNDLTRLRKLEFIPFAEAFKQQADAVMVAHILLPKVDDQYPATLSKKIMTDLLRKELGFEGVIMTDDMTMGAIIKNYALGEAAVKSVLAGTNVVLVGHDYDKVVTVVEALRKAVEEKRIPMDIVDQSVVHIMKLKQRYQLTDEVVRPPDIESLNTAVRRVLDTYLRK
ncbi:beta-N-acetylhexosaminidase [Paenibacillus sp. SYP-B3998]|uniref:beta-N-acetylhexosaminidase n=1 Tax=Paenibacillus sp. SYP-B3998 TaxID=2678564 RepID=A0A6G3ZSM0_9BACL|nr:beta-N-acetylhexosaminidase [Paenibacillus sp. SYP-B3998]NEW04417.1 beta-N-acetylhexosaminidase [Paenibacillus sp. SYP-B3998]